MLQSGDARQRMSIGNNTLRQKSRKMARRQQGEQKKVFFHVTVFLLIIF